MKKFKTLLAILAIGSFTLGPVMAQDDPGQSKVKTTTKKGAQKTGHAAKEGGKAVGHGAEKVGHTAKEGGEAVGKGAKQAGQTAKQGGQAVGKGTKKGVNKAKDVVK